MRTIHKFQLEITDHQELYINHGSVILDAQMQNDKLCLWAIVDNSAPKVSKFFRIYGTGGQDIDQEGAYVATVQEDGFVWHLFEVLS